MFCPSAFGFRADINKDGTVNFLDLSILGNEWLEMATTITTVSDLAAYKDTAGTYYIDANGGSSGTYTLTESITITADWTLIPINGNVTIDGDGSYYFHVKDANVIFGDTIGTYTLTFTKIMSGYDHWTTSSATTSEYHYCHFTNTTTSGNNFGANGANGAKLIVKLYNCIAKYDTPSVPGESFPSDGFNIHGTLGGANTTKHEMWLYNCIAINHYGTPFCNGATAHESCRLYIYGGDYSNNYRNIVCIQDSKTYMYGNINVDDGYEYGILISGAHGEDPNFETERPYLYIGADATISIINNDSSQTQPYKGIGLTRADADIHGTITIDGYGYLNGAGSVGAFHIIYPETPTRDININGNITIRNAPSYSLAITGAIGDSPTATLSGFNIQATDFEPVAGQYNHAVYISKPGTFTINNCRLKGDETASGAICLLSTRAIDLTLTKSLIYDFSNGDSDLGKGVNALNNNHTLTVENCTFYNNHWHMDIRTGSTTSFKNNIFSDGEQYGIYVDGGLDYGDINGSYNWFFDNEDDVSDGSNLDVTDTTAIDPEFVNAENEDFTLALTSPCIGAADDGGDIGY